MGDKHEIEGENLNRRPLTEREVFGNQTNLAALPMALARAMGEMPSIPRNKTVLVRTKTGGTYTFKYAPLDTILAVLRPVLAANGLAVVQDTEWSNTELAVATTITHESGEFVTLGTMRGKTEHLTGPQELGSLITYLRRYSLTTALCLATEDDDDGNAAAGNEATVTKEAPQSEHGLPDAAIVARINACESMDQLAALWETLTPSQRLANGPAKNARKASLS